MSGLAKKRLTKEMTLMLSGPKENVKRMLRLVDELDFKLVDDSPSRDWREVLEGEIKKYTEPGAALAGARMREGLNQSELAKRCETTQSAVSAMENGYRPIGKKMAKRIAKVLKSDYRTFL